MQLEGGCQLSEQGVFSVFVGGRGMPRAPMTSESLRQNVREIYDFLMTDEQTRQVGERTLVRTFTRSSRRLPKVTVPILDAFQVTLIHVKDKAPGFCKFVLGLPFESSEDGNNYMRAPWSPQDRQEDDDGGSEEWMP